MHFRILCTVVALLLGASSTTRAQSISTLLATVRGESITVYLYMPEGAGPAPLMVLSHGSPRNAEDRATFGADTLTKQANAFAALGLAVAVPIRRGYGGHGTWAESYGRCESPDYYAAGMAGADDIAAAIGAVAGRPGIDHRRIVLAGHSAGGWASLATATRERVRGVINFAGGRGSQHPGEACMEDELVNAAARFGAESRVPELWIYSANDRYFGPALARRMFAAFTAAGGNATFVAAPAYSGDGHQYVQNMRGWMPEVKRFLREIGTLR